MMQFYGGQRYSLMNMDAMKASHIGNRRHDAGLPLPVTSNTFVYIENTTHVIEPVSNDKAEAFDDSGKHSLFTALSAHSGTGYK